MISSIFVFLSVALDVHICLNKQAAVVHDVDTVVQVVHQGDEEARLLVRV